MNSRQANVKRLSDFMEYLEDFAVSRQSLVHQLSEASLELKSPKQSNKVLQVKYSLPQDYFEGKARMFGRKVKRQAELEALGSELLGIRPKTKGSQLVNRKLLSSEQSRLALKATKRKVGVLKNSASINYLKIIRDGAKVLASRKMRQTVEGLVQKQSNKLWLNHLARRRLAQKNEEFNSRHKSRTHSSSQSIAVLSPKSSCTLLGKRVSSPESAYSLDLSPYTAISRL